MQDRTREQEIYWALKDVSFNVSQGERIGVIGPNGSGKSTLLKILSRIVTPTGGRVELSGRVASLLEVGTGFHPELSGRENIYLNGSILGMTRKEIKSRFDEIVSFAEVERFLDTPVKRYSSGMRVRLAYSVAAHLDADIIIVDEVLAVGDAAFQRKCIGNMQDMSGQGRTILFVSHNMGIVQSLCNRLILLESGQIVSQGDPAPVIRSYLASSEHSDSESLSSGYWVNKEKLEKSGTQDFRITSLELINPSNPEHGPRTGDPLIIRIHYSANRDWHSPAFILGVKDPLGYEILRLSTSPISGFVIDEIFSSGCIQLTLDSLPLVSGEFYIDVGFARERHEFILRLENIIKMNVAAFDVYKSGFPLDRTRGILVVPHQWQHTEEKP